MRLAFESVDSVKDLNRKKGGGGGRKRNFMLFSALLLELERLISSSLLPSYWLYPTGSPAS